jgi:Cys-tRNA(Pro)/Cys-tRNA(Cys) deacylase
MGDNENMETKVTDYLEAQGIAFEIKQHQRPALTCETAAAERGVRVSQIVKCMIAETDKSKLIVMLLPGDRTLKSSKARKWLKVASLQLVPPERLEKDHGLIVGAISPVEFIGKATILMDPSVFDEEIVDISSGDPLAGIELSSTSLCDALKADVVDIVSANPQGGS